MRIFIHNIDSYLGNVLAKQLFNNDERNRLFACNSDSSTVPNPNLKIEGGGPSFDHSTIHRMVSASKPKDLTKCMLTCQLVVFDLHQGDELTQKNLDHYLEAIQDLASQNEEAPGLEKETVCIVVSSAMSWDGTPQPVHEEQWAEISPNGETRFPLNEEGNEVLPATFQIGGFIEVAGQDDEEGNPVTENIFIAENGSLTTASGETIEWNSLDPKPTPDCHENIAGVWTPSPWSVPEKPLRAFKGSDYTTRTNTREEFETMKATEEKVLRMNGAGIANFKTIVINAGVLYGNGEKTLAPLFKSAWLCQKQFLIRGDGQNVVPMCHANEVAKLVGVLGKFEATEEGGVHLAVEASPTTQQGLMQGIVDAVAEPHEVLSCEPNASFCNLEPADGEDTFPELEQALVLNLNMEPSPLLAPQPDEEGNVPAQANFVDNIPSVAQDFCDQQNLRPIKVLVISEGSGGSPYPQMISEHYGNPMVTKDNLEGNVSNYRGYVLAEGVGSFEESAELFVPKLPEPVFDEEGNEIPVPEEEPEIDEETGEPIPKKKVFNSFAPDFVIEFKNNVTEDEVVTVKRVLVEANEEEGVEEVAEYEMMMPDSGVCDFFKNEMEMEVLTIYQSSAPVAYRVGHNSYTYDLTKDTVEDVFMAIRMHMEKNGRPYNYLAPETDANQSYIELKEQRYVEQKAKEEAAKAEEVASEEAKQAKLFGEMDQRVRLAEVHANKNKTASNNLSTHEFLMKYAMASLADSSGEVIRNVAEDPIEAFAKRLEEAARQ